SEEMDQIQLTSQTVAEGRELGVQVAQLVPPQRLAPHRPLKPWLQRAEPLWNIVVVVSGGVLFRSEAKRIEMIDESWIPAVHAPVPIAGVLETHPDPAINVRRRQGSPPHIPGR